MPATTFRGEERVGLILAVAAHAALIVWLALRPATPPLPPPARIEVTLADDVAASATSPEPKAKAAPDVAPTLGEPAPAPVAKIAPAPTPVPAPPPPVPHHSRPVVKPAPAEEKPAPPRPAKHKPLATPTAHPAADPIAAILAGEHPPVAPAMTPAKHAPKAAPAKPAKNPGATRLGSDFLKGVSGAEASGAAKSPAAATIGPAVRAALAGAIARALKPHWQAPQGVDADQLVTVIAWDLNADGTLAGSPRVVRQDGVTDSNRPQAARHAELAMRAVQLAAPFPLPPDLYDGWKHVAFHFDRKLSQ